MDDAMVHIPKNIQELVSYKPGKPVAQIIEELQLSKTAILWNNENNLGASPRVAETIAQVSSSLHLYPDPSSKALCEAIASANNCRADQVR